MHIRYFTAVCCVLALPVGTTAQVSGYVSTGYGHNENPLYNYERLPDQINQSYFELNSEKQFETSMLKFGYVGGLMIFNHFTDRNYYEHSLSGNYIRTLLKNSPPVLSRESVEGDNEKSASNEMEVRTPADDSTNAYLNVGLKAGARHDKEAYKEFDNFGAELSASYRFVMSDPLFTRIVNTFGYRRYAYLEELSNVTDILNFELGNNADEAFQYGMRAAAGLKHYTSLVYDTTRFEQRRSYNPKSQGKGKPGAILKDPSSKRILISPQSNATYQVEAGLYLGRKWTGSSLSTGVTYRYNPHSTARYLAQYVSSSILSEDIYNDHFNYQGPHVQLAYRQDLPLGFMSTLTLELQRKTFDAPAFNLDGDEISNKRRDLRSSAEFLISRSIDLFDGASLELSLLSGLLRNQSNDDYNDFSAFSILAALGINF